MRGAAVSPAGCDLHRGAEMRIRVLGAGWYGAHLSLALIEDGHEVEVHEIADRIFAGASGAIPARAHLGFHYPRSRVTRAACLEHNVEFLDRYGFLTRGVPVNIYAVAKDHSMIDYPQYVRTLEHEVQFIEIREPGEFGLQNVEGAILTGERHILSNMARPYFAQALGNRIKLLTEPGLVDNPHWDFTIDCTFCANDSAGVDRYEPCLVVMLEGPTDTCVTIMDGQFPSLYVWDEHQGLSSLSSALWTPFSKTCKTWAEAQALLKGLTYTEIRDRAEQMLDQMAHFYPAVKDRYRIADCLTSTRAMPLSGADTRLVDVIKVGARALRVRAGKIDAVHAAERRVKELIAQQ
jgi:hypothetical protein